MAISVGEQNFKGQIAMLGASKEISICYVVEKCYNSNLY
jgi:hypothetical protein